MPVQIASTDLPVGGSGEINPLKPVNCPVCVMVYGGKRPINPGGRTGKEVLVHPCRARKRCQRIMPGLISAATDLSCLVLSAGRGACRGKSIGENNARNLNMLNKMLRDECVGNGQILVRHGGVENEERVGSLYVANVCSGLSP